MASGVTGSRFVGRQPELGRLHRVLLSSSAGEPTMVLVAGEAGIGKSRLVEEFAGQVDTNAQVLFGSCLRLSGGGLPYGPIVDALRGVARSLGHTEPDGPLGSPSDELTRLLPAATPSRSRAPVGEFARSRLFELVLRFLDRLAQERPVVLAVEDIHWADRSTLDLLMFLVRMVRHERLMILATYRSDELHPRHRLQLALAELERCRNTVRLELTSFDREDMGLLLAGILGQPPSPATVQHIFARSDGNAFLAEELLAANDPQCGQALPRRLQDFLLARIATLAEDTRHVLRLIATVGRPTEHQLLAAAAQLPEDRLLAAAREAVDRQVLRAEGDQYGFRHVLLQQAVYAELLPGERVRFHRAVARALAEDSQASALRKTSMELAHHWYEARDYRQALTASIAAARAAVDVYGFSEAHHQYERALSLWPQVPDAHRHASLTLPNLRLAAAEAARWAGLPDQAATLTQEALAELEAQLPPTPAAILHAQLAEYQDEAGNTKAALAAYEEASRLVADEAASAEKARVLAGHGTELMRQNKYSASRVICEQAIAVARAAGALAEEGRALNTLGCDLSGLGDPDAGIAALRHALRLSEAAGNTEDLHRAYYNLSVVLWLDAGRPHEALETSLRGLEQLREQGLELALPSSLLRGTLARQLWDLGRWEQAEDLLREEVPRELPPGWALDRQLLAGRLHMTRGRFELANEQAARLAEQSLDPVLDVCLQAYRAELATLQLDYPTARSAVAKALQHVADSEQSFDAIWLCSIGLRATADAAERARDRRAPASALADVQSTGERLLVTARQSLVTAGPNLPEAAAHAATCEAEFTRMDLRSDPELWADVITKWDGLSRPYEAAYARWRQAEALLAARAPKAAASALRQAHQTTVQLGEKPLRQEVERLAQRARIDLMPRANPKDITTPSSPATQHGLTGREQQVLQYLIEGRTNRQIARALFISEKTASVHVSNIMSKLDATNRSEAAAIAHRLRLLEPDA
jgi:DNA-binding CsgD family transcriptional regulator/tetratricopeptide (TPR) repeat protein